MITYRGIACSLAIAGALAVAAPSALVAAPLTIQYQAIDLPDVVAGQDLWEYEYAVSGVAFLADQAFSTYFDPALYSTVEDPPPPVNADWDILTVQPDPALPSSGFYNPLALVDNASLADLFVVSFVWLGSPGTTPGSQPFTLDQFDAAGDYVAALQTGTTTPMQSSTNVPEPSTLLLMSIGLAGLIQRRRRPR